MICTVESDLQNIYVQVGFNVQVGWCNIHRGWCNVHGGWCNMWGVTYNLQFTAFVTDRWGGHGHCCGPPNKAVAVVNDGHVSEQQVWEARGKARLSPCPCDAPLCGLGPISMATSCTRARCEGGRGTVLRVYTSLEKRCITNWRLVQR
jgi:hypothetical protein